MALQQSVGEETEQKQIRNKQVVFSFILNSKNITIESTIIE